MSAGTMTTLIVEIYDTTLRDGTQGLGVTLGLADKLALTGSRSDAPRSRRYIEGGWPGSNPKDAALFPGSPRGLSPEHAKIVIAFGSTRHALCFCRRGSANLRELVAERRGRHLHLRQILGSSRHGCSSGDARGQPGDDPRLGAVPLSGRRSKPVFYDAVSTSSTGSSANCAYALDTVGAALEAGAVADRASATRTAALFPHRSRVGVRAVHERFPAAKLGIHVHNDGGLAVANTLAAVESGCIQVQGTINGVGERCGNVDLTQVIANLELKLGIRCVPPGQLAHLTELSRVVWERMNAVGPVNQPYVGTAAFAHKGGIHVSAMQRNERTYEHVPPESVGNTRRILVSELAGRSNVLAQAVGQSSRHPELTDDKIVTAVLNDVVARENEGYSFESADGSFDLLVRKHLGTWRPAFDLSYYRGSRDRHCRASVGGSGRGNREAHGSRRDNVSPPRKARGRSTR